MDDFGYLLQHTNQLDLEATKQKVLSANFRDIELDQGTVVLARLLLHEKPTPSEAFTFPLDTAYGARLMRVKEKSGRLFRTLTNWFYVHSGRHSVLYALYLYNMKYCHTRKVFNLLLAQKTGQPPYLYRVIHNIIAAYFPEQHLSDLLLHEDDLDRWTPTLNWLFSDLKPAEQWLQSINENAYYYGGRTNTVLGMYDEQFVEKSGAHLLNRNADAYYDLGGGYATPEITRLTDLPFTCLDIQPPGSHTDRLLLVRKAPSGERLVSGDEKEAYLRRLAETPYQRFDVFENSFPTNHQSYVIASTGFLTSTVRPTMTGSFQRRGFQATSLAGIREIMRLVQQGKDVDLFTISRATARSYTNRTVMISFRQGRVVDLVTTPEPIDRFRLDRQAEILRLIHPETSPFGQYIRPFDGTLLEGKRLPRP